MHSRDMVAPKVTGRPGETGDARRDLPRLERLRLAGLVSYIGLITLLFLQPLWALFVHASQNSMHSHIPLVPLIAGYMLYVRRPAAAYRTCVTGAAIASGVGLATLAGAMAVHSRLTLNDHLAMMTLAFVNFLAAGGFLFLGSRWMTAAAFPIAFLIFMVPLPDAAVHWLETMSVLASADAAALFFNVSGTLLVRNGTLFELPGITLSVAQECSGIRSSWVLFITSVAASHLILESRWRRIVLVAFVIPLAIARNGFRIFVIGLLCIRVGPHMIESVIHHRGGPIFFALSLIPLFLLLVWLRRGEQHKNVPG